MLLKSNLLFHEKFPVQLCEVFAKKLNDKHIKNSEFIMIKSKI